MILKIPEHEMLLKVSQVVILFILVEQQTQTFLIMELKNLLIQMA